MNKSSTSSAQSHKSGPRTSPTRKGAKSSFWRPVRFLSGLTRLQVISRTSFWDTFSGTHHSRDFSFARASYFRRRVIAIGLIFLLLTPVWALFDWFVLPQDRHATVLVARIILTAGLLLTVLLAYWARNRILPVCISVVLLCVLPGAFYVVVLATSGGLKPQDLIGYDFIPYMLMAMLGIFPLTLLEGTLLAAVFVAIEIYAQLVAGQLFYSAGLQALWLLFAILVITLTASYFHLGLLLRLYREATHDGLTGLMNRTAFIDSVGHLAKTQQVQNMALLMLDLDYFKRLNDRHGHSVGDMVLQEFAKILRSRVRSTDFVARYGGEEFVIALVNTEHQEAMQVAEAIRLTTENTTLIDHEGQPVHFTVSIGVTMVAPGDALSNAMQRADSRLYEAKQISRNRVVGV